MPSPWAALLLFDPGRGLERLQRCRPPVTGPVPLSPGAGPLQLPRGPGKNVSDFAGSTQPLPAAGALSFVSYMIF